MAEASGDRDYVVMMRCELSLLFLASAAISSLTYAFMGHPVYQPSTAAVRGQRLSMGKNSQAELMKKLQEAKAKKAGGSQQQQQAAPSSTAAAQPAKPLQANTAWREGSAGSSQSTETDEYAAQRGKPGRGGRTVTQKEDNYAAFEDLLQRTDELCFREDQDGEYIQLDTGAPRKVGWDEKHSC